MTTSNPVGLIRFQRSLVSKRSDTCFFCGVTTAPGVDFAALDNGKWIGVCALHANSVVEQCKALLLLIQADAVTFGLTADDLAAVNAHAPANVADVLAGNVDIPTAIAAATKLTDALGAVRSHKPADPIIGKLQAVVAGATATDWERGFAASLLGQIAQGRTLSEKQVATATRIIEGASAPATTVAPVCEPVDSGVYVAAGSTYLVHLSKAGRLYAMILASTPVANQKLDWQYCPGGIKVIERSGRPVTPEEAAALGHVSSYCCFCSRPLRNEKDGCSVEVGYGPVCASKHGLPWG